MDDNLQEGKEWRREIQRRLNSTALVVLILSPDAITSPWVLYEWHYSLIAQQSEPFIVHFRNCDDNDLKRFTDYQLAHALVENEEQAKEVWIVKASEIEQTLEKIATRLQQFRELRELYDILTKEGADHTLQQSAADKLGAVPDVLKLAAANYLIEALQFWLSRNSGYGYVLASIAGALGRLGKRKAIPILGQLLIAQVGQTNVLAVVERALNSLSFEETA